MPCRPAWQDPLNTARSSQSEGLRFCQLQKGDGTTAVRPVCRVGRAPSPPPAPAPLADAYSPAHMFVPPRSECQLRLSRGTADRYDRQEMGTSSDQRCDSSLLTVCSRVRARTDEAGGSGLHTGSVATHEGGGLCRGNISRVHRLLLHQQRQGLWQRLPCLEAGGWHLKQPCKLHADIHVVRESHLGLLVHADVSGGVANPPLCVGL